MTAPDIEQTIQRIIDQEHTPEDVAYLNRVLPVDAQARRYFIKMVRLHHELQNLLATESQRALDLQLLEQDGVAANVVALPQRASGQVSKNRSSWLSWAAAATILATSGAIYWSQRPAKVAFRVSKVEQAQGSEAIQAGLALSAGKMVILNQGIARLDSENGTSLWLQGPASLRVNSTNEVTLNSGTMWCEMDHSNLMIHTPFANIRDIGTKFGITANINNVRVDVLQGTVEATDPLNPKNKTIVGAGDQLIIKAGTWNHTSGKAEFAAYCDSPLSAVGIVRVPTEEAGSLIRNQFVMDTRWTPVMENSGSIPATKGRFGVTWSAGGAHLGMKTATLEDLLFSSHWLGKSMSYDMKKKLSSLGLPVEDDGVVIHFEGMLSWLNEIGARGYRVEVYRTSTNAKGEFTTVTAYSGTKPAIVSDLTTNLEGDQSSKLSVGGEQAITRFNQVFDTDRLTLSVPVRARDASAPKSCISAVRVIPTL